MKKRVEEPTATGIKPTRRLVILRTSTRYATAHVSVLTAPRRIAVESTDITHESASIDIHMVDRMGYIFVPVGATAVPTVALAPLTELACTEQPVDERLPGRRQEIGQDGSQH
jgi:hypothetical protein